MTDKTRPDYTRPYYTRPDSYTDIVPDIDIYPDTDPHPDTDHITDTHSAQTKHTFRPQKSTQDMTRTVHIRLDNTGLDHIRTMSTITN